MQLPRDVGQYRLEAVLGQGGMGVVYRAVDVALDRPCAIKMISLGENMAGEERDVAVRRFQREAKAAAAIQSRHVAQVLNFGRTDDGDLYIVMELLDGRPLSHLLAAEQRLSAVRTVRIARQLCRGLTAAHDLGIIHRDLKPANVMIVRADGIDEFAKLLDFGVAKLTNSTREVSSPTAAPTTEVGIVMGTVNAMAPEQLEGGAVDARTDVYALGLMLYRMLTGTPVFEGDTGDIIRQVLRCDPQPLRQRAPGAGIPASVEAVVLACLERDPAKRPHTMRELEIELARAVGFDEVADPSGDAIVRSPATLSDTRELDTHPTQPLPLTLPPVAPPAAAPAAERPRPKRIPLAAIGGAVAAVAVLGVVSAALTWPGGDDGAGGAALPAAAAAPANAEGERAALQAKLAQLAGCPHKCAQTLTTGAVEPSPLVQQLVDVCIEECAPAQQAATESAPAPAASAGPSKAPPPSRKAQPKPVKPDAFVPDLDDSEPAAPAAPVFRRVRTKEGG